MEIIHHIEQGSQEWLDLRIGLITCSEIATIRADGKGAQTYINGLAYERITGESSSVFQGNEWTERGHEFEGAARDLYSQKTGHAVYEVSFVKNKGFGYSPDGLVGTDNTTRFHGAIEVKVKKPNIQIHILRTGEIPTEHLDQLIGGLSCAELDWIDFVSYCPNLPLFVKRIYKTEVQEKIHNIESLVNKYNIQIEEVKDLIMDMY